MTNTTVNTISYYTFGSPRYHSVTNATTIVVPEDYLYHDSTLGTYDMNFPLYAVAQTPVPVAELINQEGVFSNVTGAVAPFLGQSAYQIKTIGKSTTQSIPTNSNLDSKTVQYDEYLNSKLNPAWCVIQNYLIPQGSSSNIQIPRYVVRILGNTLLSTQLYALQLQPSASGVLYNTFPAGIIVSYNNNLWKCITDTITYPPNSADVQDDYWISLYNKINVFSADLFMFDGASTTYFKEVNDTTRYFNPLVIDDSLVSWNLAYWED